MQKTPNFNIDFETHQAVMDLPFELQGLTQAVRYQMWLTERVYSYLGNSILEFGAGVGNLSRWLPLRERLILTEHDPRLFSILERSTEECRKRYPNLRVLRFNLGQDDIREFRSDNIDTIISFNVMEHIEDDETAFRLQVEILNRAEQEHPGTRKFRRVIAVVPAHEFAFGEIDKTFQHYRRYSKDHIQRLVERVCPKAELHIQFMNLLGLFGWWVQGRLFRKKQIGLSSIQTFEALCPMIRPMDDWIHDVFRLPFGQSLIAVVTLPNKHKN